MEWKETVRMEKEIDDLEAQWAQKAENESNKINQESLDITEEVINNATVSQKLDNDGRTVVTYTENPASLPYIPSVIEGKKSPKFKVKLTLPLNYVFLVVIEASLMS